MYRKFSIFLVLILFAVQQIWPQQPNIIYVTPTGNGTGTQANPAGLAFAVANAGPGKQIRLAAGTYQLNNTFHMTSGLTLEGGYDPVTWCKNSSLKSKIIRTDQNVTPNPNRLVAISCVNISNFYIFDVEIETQNAVGNGVTTYGIYLNGCSDYSIVRCKVKAGNGSDGLPGLNGQPGMNGAPGVNGGNGCQDCSCAPCRQGGAGGSGSFPGSFAGGNGGNGGIRSGNNNCPPSSNGTAGLPGQGPGGGAGGGGGAVVCGIVSIGCDGNGPAAQGQPGQPGANGADGADGADGVAAFAGGYFQPATGQNGQQGQHGSGGGGGGGGGSQSGLLIVFGNPNDDGPGGAGGGEGGQGGFGATGGGGGGGSFGVFVWNNGPNGKLIDTQVESGLPGQGAPGGQVGGAGGIGGNGGPGLNRDGCDIGRGGPGGKGGNGGKGGKGGNGNPGVSFAIWENPNGQPIQQSSFAGPAEPQITVCGLGCTYSEFTFSTNAFGFIQWFFDGGTVPLIATGPTATVHYTTPGRHTVTLVVNGLPYIFSEFVGVFQDGTPHIPVINSADTVICPGTTAQFSSSSAALNYRWNFQGGVPPQIMGPGNQNVSSTFNNTGTYWVTLQTESQTCGWSVPDSVAVEVLPVLAPEVLVSSSGAQICNGQSVTFGASPVNGGSNPQFLWFVDGVNTGFTGPVFTQNNLTAPITVTAQMTSSYACPQPPVVTSLPVNVTVYPQPSLNCSFLGNYLGAPTIFTPIPSGGTGPYTFLWNFGDGGISADSVATHQFSGTGQYHVSVVATDANGCQAFCSIPVNIIVAPQVEASFSIDLQAQCGHSVAQFFDNSSGNVISWFWNFGDGNTSTQQNPVHTYNVPGLYTVMLVASNGVNFDTAYAPNAVVVEALPTAGISSLQRIACEPFQVQFQDASSGATSWLWDFGDGSPQSALQNPLHWYTQAGSYTVTLIVSNNISGCTDTITEVNYVIINPSPKADFSADATTVCTGRPVQFTNLSSGGDQFRWNFGDGNESAVQNPVHIYNGPGQYTVFLEVTGPGPSFCKGLELKPLYIQVKQTPVAGFSADPTVVQLPFNQVTFTDLSIGADFVKWNFGNGQTSDIRNPVAFYPDSGQYLVTQFAGTDFGCNDTATMNIVVQEQMIIYVPSAFTPDGDNINEELVIGTRGLKKFEMTIFNRWGEAVFRTSNPEFFWNGKTPDGRDHPPGVYAYVINYQYYLGPEQSVKGSVFLIR